MELGETPVERAVSWLIDMWRAGDAITPDDVAQRFAPSFLEEYPTARVVEMLQQPPLPRLEIRTAQIDSPTQASIIVADEDGSARITAQVDPIVPHRFIALGLTPAEEEVGNWAKVRRIISRLDRCESALDPTIAERIARTRDEHQIPGLVAGVLRGGELVHRQGLGVGDLDMPGALWTDDIFRGGSLAKIVTAIALLQLVDDGILGLDDPVEEHLRAFSIRAFDPSGPPITIKQILTHTAGLPRHQGFEGDTVAELVGGELRATSKPGARSYSNIGFAALGQLIEDVAGGAYAAFVSERIFKPLGMSRSSISRDGSSATARGYAVQSGRLAAVTPLTIVEEAAGALCTTVEDLAVLARAVLDRDPRLCSPAALDVATRGESSGLAFLLHDLQGHRIVWHNGGLPGWKAAWYVAPDDELAVILMGTRFEAPLDELARELLAALLD